MQTGFTISKKAEGDVLPHRLLVNGAEDGSLKIAVDATKPFVGVSTEMGSSDGSVVDAFIDRIPNVEYGGNVSLGDKLTSDGVGRAVVTTTGGDNIIGIALMSGVEGDIGEVLIDRAIA